MHELSVYANVAPSKHHLILSILAGLTSMQPQPVLERRLQFVPVREPSSPASPDVRKRGTEMGIPKAFIDGTFRVQVVGDISRMNSTGNEAAVDASDFERYKFRCEFKDFPEVPGKRPATSRIAESVAVPEGKRTWMLNFMDGIGYKFVTEMIRSGERFTHGNIDIRLLRTYALPPSGAPVDIAPRDTSPLTPVDTSGCYQIQATLLVAEDNKPEVMSGAFDEMNRLKDLLRGIVDLKIGERLAMNTRIR